MSEIEGLAAAALAAEDAERKQNRIVGQMEAAYRKFIDDAVVAARKAATEQAEVQFRIGIKEAEAERLRLLAISDQTAIAHGAAKLATMHAGTWCHWDRPYRGAGERVVERGILEVWTRESVSPDNQQHGLPVIGSVAMRLLKKDGTPSTRVARDFWHGWGDAPTPNKDWRPEVAK